MCSTILGFRNFSRVNQYSSFRPYGNQIQTRCPKLRTTITRRCHQENSQNSHLARKQNEQGPQAPSVYSHLRDSTKTRIKAVVPRAFLSVGPRAFLPILIQGRSFIHNKMVEFQIHNSSFQVKIYTCRPTFKVRTLLPMSTHTKNKSKKTSEKLTSLEAHSPLYFNVLSPLSKLFHPANPIKKF